jgi:hypothetical protein
MSTIETKFSIGELVKHFTGVPGMITAIFHRSGKNSYEMSYLEGDKPTCVSVEEYEICTDSDYTMGFKRKT